MKAFGKRKKKLIYALKFKDLPFREIDKYVCVPFPWIIHQLDEQTVLVAYPENEAPFVTRNRTKKREKHDPEWRFYLGYIKFESEIYEDVVQWIEEMLANGADDQDESEIKDSYAEPAGSRQLRSSKNPHLSGILPEKLRKPLPKMLIRRPLPLRPWNPKRIEPAGSSPNTPSRDKPVVVENQVIQNAVNHESTEQNADDRSQEKSVDTSAQSPQQLPEERQPSPVQDEQPLSMPEIDDSDVEIEVEVESQPIQEEKPPSKSSEQAQPNPVNETPASVTDREYALIESRLHEIHTGQPKEAIDIKKTSLAENPTARPPSRAHQPPQEDYPQPSVTPCSKQQQGTVGTSPKVINSYQKHLQDHRETIPSTTYYTPSPIDLSSRRQIPAIRRKSLSVIKKPVEKKARLENITKNTPTSQQSYKQQLNYANHGDVINHRHPLQTMNKSAAQNLSQLAHRARYYGPSQLLYLQQMAQMQGMISQSNIPYIDQRTYLPNLMARGYVSQNQPSQSSQFLPQNQRPMVNTNQMPELRHELVAPPLAAQNQLARNLDNPERQDPRVAKPRESQSNYGKPKPQVTEERPATLPKTNHQLLNDKKNNSRKDLLKKLSLGPVKHFEICGAAPEITQDSETQTTSESQEKQSKQGSENNTYQHPESRKMVADQATEVESIDDRNDETFASPLESIDSWYERPEHSTKEQESSQETQDFEMGSVDKELLDTVSTDGLDHTNEDHSEDDISTSITDEKSMGGHNLMPGTQKNLANMTEQEMLEIHGLLLTKMYKNFLNTEEFYNDLRDSTLVCLKLYETLLDKVEKVKVIESPPIPTSNTSEVSQAAQETPVPAEKNSNDDHNNSSVKNSPTKNKRRHTFVLPPEYDPNDSRWTLKHRNPGPRLMELMPQSHVYVSKAEYKKCIRVSNNCRTLARTLLTAVFSKNALSVCSPTGAKARAFNTLENDVRPGLDENARMVLLAFIEDYGSKRNWNTSDTAGIMSSIRTKIQEIRKKYGKTKVQFNSNLAPGAAESVEH